MRIGIFGGAFNPPHKGHVLAAKTAALSENLDLLIVIPTGTPPHKQMPAMTPPPDIRLLMTENAFSGTKDTVISDMEVFSGDSNYTIDTVAVLQKKYPDATFFLLVGNDMYDTLDTWKDSEKLLKAVTPVLLPRDVTPVSSSQIRGLLPGRDGLQYLSEENYSLIIRHRYYDAKPDWQWLQSKAYAMLDERRIPHVKACEVSAIELSEHWGADVDAAREAAILHDITKKLDFNENMCIIAEHGHVTNNYNIYEAKLLHSVTAALLAKSVFGVSDTVAHAIKVHTTGCANMSLLDKIIYLADYIEATRDFPTVPKLRQLAFENIDKAMIMGLEMVVGDLLSRGITPNNSTYEALRDLGAK
ncbi:MAG: bis(5'-nucleosyl)-tetraphosphatase (symmetrical) YqeK [Oscillospiraceae bacterium]|nr:bis(5'-nucleosyl)-tetraphosphatase (symmetrical) YqeK [Oscillospiraceae bacterium]